MTTDRAKKLSMKLITVSLPFISTFSLIQTGISLVRSETELIHFTVWTELKQIGFYLPTVLIPYRCSVHTLEAIDGNTRILVQTAFDGGNKKIELLPWSEIELIQFDMVVALLLEQLQSGDSG